MLRVLVLEIIPSYEDGYYWHALHQRIRSFFFSRILLCVGFIFVSKIESSSHVLNCMLQKFALHMLTASFNLSNKYLNPNHPTCGVHCGWSCTTMKWLINLKIFNGQNLISRWLLIDQPAHCSVVRDAPFMGEVQPQGSCKCYFSNEVKEPLIRGDNWQLTIG